MSLLTAALSVLPPSLPAIGSLGLHCFVIQARAAECFSCVARDGLHDSTSHEPPAMALDGFPASHHARPRTLLHVLPYASALRGLFTTLVTLAAYWSSSTTLRADSPQHAPSRAAGGLLVLQRRSHLLRALREEVVDPISPALSWEATPSTDITSPGLAVSKDWKLLCLCLCDTATTAWSTGRLQHHCVILRHGVIVGSR